MLHPLSRASTCRKSLLDRFKTVVGDYRYRIKDPKVSLDFYTRILGFTLLEKLDFPDMKFSLYFLGQYPPEQIPEDSNERVMLLFHSCHTTRTDYCSYFNVCKFSQQAENVCHAG